MSAQEERAIEDIAYTVYGGKNFFSSGPFVHLYWLTLAASDTVSLNVLVILKWLVWKFGCIDNLCDWYLLLFHGHQPWRPSKSSKRDWSCSWDRSSPWLFRSRNHALRRSDLSRGVTVQTTPPYGHATLPYRRRSLQGISYSKRRVIAVSDVPHEYLQVSCILL